LTKLRPRAPAGKTFLVRVFVDIDRSPTEVVTVCRTSQIARSKSQDFGGRRHEILDASKRVGDARRLEFEMVE
jgi:hypothetical protein